MSQVDEFASMSSVKDALKQLLDSPAAAKAMGPGRAAQKAWFQVNGDIERAHTCGTYVTRPRKPGQAPTFVVYTDTHARAIDFRANREVYQARMAAAGFTFSEIRFEQNRRPRPQGAAGAQKGRGAGSGAGAAAAAGASRQELPELTHEERDRARQACRKLSPALREKVYEAMCASLRRQKAEISENGD